MQDSHVLNLQKNENPQGFSYAFSMGQCKTHMVKEASDDRVQPHACLFNLISNSRQCKLRLAQHEHEHILSVQVLMSLPLLILVLLEKPHMVYRIPMLGASAVYQA